MVQQSQHLNPARLKVPYPICRRGFCKFLQKRTKSLVSQSYQHLTTHQRLNMMGVSQKPQSVKSSRYVQSEKYSKRRKIEQKHNQNSKSVFDLPESSNDYFKKYFYQQIWHQRNSLMFQIQEKDSQLILLRKCVNSIVRESAKQRTIISRDYFSTENFQTSQDRGGIIQQQQKQNQQQPMNRLLNLKERLQKINIQNIINKKKRNRFNV